jgi:hypothetical protein
MERRSIDPGALLGRSYPLPSGHRVRLRLLRQVDGPAVRELVARAGHALDELELQRLLRYDPLLRTAIAATTAGGRGEELLGIGAIDRFPGADPDLVVVTPRCGEPLEQLIDGVLRARSRRTAA